LARFILWERERGIKNLKQRAGRRSSASRPAILGLALLAALLPSVASADTITTSLDLSMCSTGSVACASSRAAGRGKSARGEPAERRWAPRGMRASKARAERRARQVCHRRWNTYGKSRRWLPRAVFRFVPVLRRYYGVGPTARARAPRLPDADRRTQQSARNNDGRTRNLPGFESSYNPGSPAARCGDVVAKVDVDLTMGGPQNRIFLDLISIDSSLVCLRHFAQWRA
jgi:hypothetical protein